MPSVRSSRLKVDEAAPDEIVLRVPDGVPLDGVLRAADGRTVADVSLVAGESKARTDADGRFTLPWVAAGRTSIWVREEGLAVHLGAAEVPAAGRGSVDLVLPGRASIRFRAVHGGDPSGGVASLALAGAPPETRAQAWPNSRGEYRFRYLAPGVHHLLVFAGSRPPYRAEITLKPDEERDLGEIRFAEPVDVPVELVVPSGTKVPGVIPVAAAVVEADGSSRAGVHATIVVASDGTAVLRGLAPGTYRMTVGMQGLDPVEVAFQIEGPRPSSVRVAFPPRR
jgi:hypothetical protein